MKVAAAATYAKSIPVPRQMGESEVFVTTDSEGLEERHASVEYFPRYADGDQFVGLCAGDYLYPCPSRFGFSRTRGPGGVANVADQLNSRWNRDHVNGALRCVLREIAGWPGVVGKEIVPTSAILKTGYRVGYAGNACLRTSVPATWPEFIRQRQRSSRGLMEAFKAHWQLLFKPRVITLFIWRNLLFPHLDLVYTPVFLPGLLLALFGIYWIAGSVTLLVLPLAMMVNGIMYRIPDPVPHVCAARSDGASQRARVRLYTLFYGLVLQPACVGGMSTNSSRAANTGAPSDELMQKRKGLFNHVCMPPS